MATVTEMLRYLNTPGKMRVTRGPVAGFVRRATAAVGGGASLPATATTRINRIYRRCHVREEGVEPT